VWANHGDWLCEIVPGQVVSGHDSNSDKFTDTAAQDQGVVFIEKIVPFESVSWTEYSVFVFFQGGPFDTSCRD
jgi:hypothetical protein